MAVLDGRDIQKVFGTMSNSIAPNVLQPCDSWLLRRLRALDSQFCKGAVIGWLRSIQHKTQIEAQKKIIKNSEAWAKKLKQ